MKHTRKNREREKTPFSAGTFPLKKEENGGSVQAGKDSFEDGTALIRAKGLTLSYDGSAVVKDLSFTVRAGDYIAVVGENGSGKSTLMRAVTGEIKPAAGEITRSRDIKKYGVGYLPQQSAIQRDFPASVAEVVLSGNIRRNGFGLTWSSASKERSKTYMELLGVSALSNRSFSELSGGQRQRVLLARAMCASEKLLLLDEPATGLDEGATEDLYAAIRLVNRQGTAVMMVTHDLQRAEKEASGAIRL